MSVCFLQHDIQVINYNYGEITTMSFKLKYSDVSHFEFQKAFQKLMNSPTDGKTSYTISKIASEIDKCRAQIRDEFTKEIVEKFAKREEDGTYNKDTWVPEESKLEEFQTAQEEFGKREFTVLRKPLTAYDVRDTKLTPTELISLKEAMDSASFEEPINTGKHMMSVK